MDHETFLVTGGCGLQGSHIVGKLLEAFPNAAISVMARNPTHNRFAGVQYLAGDITVAHDVERVFTTAWPTVVFHCAGTLTVGRAAVPEDVVPFVFISSASVVQKYDGGFRDLVNCDESAPTVEEEDGGQIYARSKAASERLVLAADDRRGMRTVSLRPAVMYGEADTDQIPNWLALGLTAMQIGSGTNLFSITYAGNSADAHLLAAAHLLQPNPAGVAGEAFFVTNDQPVRFWDFGRAIQRAAGPAKSPNEVRVLSPTVALCIAWASEWVVWFTGSKPMLSRPMVRYCVMNRWYNISKAKDRLGYRPKVEWEEGMKRGVKWYLDTYEKRAV